jgi:chemotaxis methyl-accepting protein methylase
MMHRMAASVTVLDCEITDIRLLLERHAGVLIERSPETLGEYIGDYLESRQLNSAAELIGLLKDSSAECDAFIQNLLCGETAFFRFPATFDALGRAVVPELRARKLQSGGNGLRMLSAGCASGEEAYSIAITVCDALAGGHEMCPVHILGSDIRKTALESAERGLYHRDELQSVPKHLIGGYFSRVGDHFLVKPRLRNLVSFTSMNLANPSFLGRFDCIFCLDVLPHFSASQRATLIQRLHLFLEPGGYLFVGENEKLLTTEVVFNPQTHLGYTYYQRPFATAARLGK